ncbi:MAG: hypothetical protein A3H29_09020 [Acidobacteria bacterium RIFCSPLOWO2_02_FULL_67_21]|nr:MAG: hypothetical protein A3H29_09020 [Acidobacteria bacterium RIFCSPLOWO2_02_FULL_67_21]
MAEPSIDISRELEVLEAELKRLEAEYNMFFAGRLPRPPWETRGRVGALVKRLDRQHVGSYADRFRFTTLQTRYSTFVDLWDRGLRAREEGRPGPFAQARPAAEAPARAPKDRIVYVTTLADPLHEMDKVEEMYERLSQARAEAGQDAVPVPFHRFVELIRTQVGTLKSGGSSEVAFRVSMKDGKVAFTARALRGVRKSGDEE